MSIEPTTPGSAERIGALHGSVVPRSQVDRDLASELYFIFSRHYRRVDPRVFEQDLQEKDWVLVLRDAAGAVRGFTTMMMFDVGCPGGRVRALFNGNTIIERDYWGDQELVRTWCAFTASLKRQEPDVPLYWYLIVSGFRTYLFLPLFFREFYPCHNRETPAEVVDLIDHLGALKFPDEYRDGVVHVSEPRECLRSTLAVPGERRLRSPHVRHFLELNPDYLRGDELVCLAEFSLANTKRTARDALLAGGKLAC